MKISSVSIAAVTVLLTVSAVFSRSGQPPQTNSADSVHKASEVQVRARVIKTPEPKYTKDAKKHKIEGTVILRCVFRSSGEVTDISVIQSLPDGLTERAIEAAKKIKFKPAVKDGHAVSMWMQLEYNFNLY
jgi:TonB family protein